MIVLIKENVWMASVHASIISTETIAPNKNVITTVMIMAYVTGKLKNAYVIKITRVNSVKRKNAHFLV
jgi:hypothetical protein